jgi:hypothetical protein
LFFLTYVASSSIASNISWVIFQVHLHHRAYKRQQELDPKYTHQTTQITNITPSLVFMASSSNPPPPERDFPANDLSPLAQDMVLNHTLDVQAKKQTI